MSGTGGSPTKEMAPDSGSFVPVDLAGDVLQINATTWALHGRIAYEGDVLVAEFHDAATAEDRLHHVPITNPSEDRR